LQLTESRYAYEADTGVSHDVGGARGRRAGCRRRDQDGRRRSRRLLAFNQLLGLHAVVAGSAGITLHLDRRLGVDLGYRYSRILAGTSMSSNRIYAQLQFGF